jgi:hypothetical protein
MQEPQKFITNKLVTVVLQGEPNGEHIPGSVV